ncbi:MAG: polyketide cyclase [Jatrophihabitans sp.]
MTGEVPASVAVSRRIDAAASDIFGVLANPARHLELDGSGMLRGSSDAMISGIGDVFVMKMHYPQLGDYEMNNHVVAYEPGRRIGWEPAAGHGHPDADADDARWGHVWSFELVPDGPGATIVTQRYDCSRAPADEAAAMDGGRIWIESMTRTLERLDELCTGRPDGAAATD